MMNNSVHTFLLNFCIYQYVKECLKININSTLNYTVSSDAAPPAFAEKSSLCIVCPRHLSFIFQLTDFFALSFYTTGVFAFFPVFLVVTYIFEEK